MLYYFSHELIILSLRGNKTLPRNSLKMLWEVQLLRHERARTFDRKQVGRSNYLQPPRPTNKDDSDPTLLEDVLHSELKCVDLLRLGLAPLLDIHVVVIETHGDVLIEEVRKPSTVVGHLAGARHARDIRMG